MHHSNFPRVSNCNSILLFLKQYIIRVLDIKKWLDYSHLPCQTLWGNECVKIQDKSTSLVLQLNAEGLMHHFHVDIKTS